MSDLELFGNAGLARDSRRLGRALSRGQAETSGRIAQIHRETDVALEKIDAVSLTTGAAMTSVVRTSLAQRNMEQITPEASGRLNYLADEHLLAVAGVLADFRRDLRRV